MTQQGPGIEVLMLAHNRESLVPSALESVLNQSRPPMSVTVFDQNSSDGTAAVVESFRGRGVELVRRSDNNIARGWDDLIARAGGPWTLVFHDDDILHPEYLRTVSGLVAAHPDATSVVSSMVMTDRPEGIPWPRVNPGRWRPMSARELAAAAYAGFRMAFPSVVYRTDALKGLSFDVARYGMLGDRPLVFSAVQAGHALVLPEPWVKYRLHPGRWSVDGSRGPFLHEVLALQGRYLGLLGDSPSTRSGRTFLRRNYRNLMIEYGRLKLAARMSVDEYLAMAVGEGAATDRSIRIGRAYAVATGLPRSIERSVRNLRDRVRRTQ